MKIQLFARPEADWRPIAPLLDRYFPAWQPLDADVEPAEEGVVLSFGGDGTFLECVRRVGERAAPILGLNAGRLGFLASVPLEGVEQAFIELKAGNYRIEQRPLLYVQGDFQTPTDFPYAFNEFSLHRGGAEMIGVIVRVDGQDVASIWGDGVLVATPAGSTAYALSVGGPVVVPGCDCIVVAPIAPHNLSMRPLVVPAASRIDFLVSASCKSAYATLDNRTFQVYGGATFAVRRAGLSARLIQLPGHSFYATLSEKMAWGIDKRAIFAADDE